MGMPKPPNATGAVFARSAKAAAYTRRRLQERPEDEGDEHGLNAPVVAQGRQRVPDNVELAGLDDDVVDKDGVDDDPDYREEPERHPEECRI
jgi:hypothetical protein